MEGYNYPRSAHKDTTKAKEKVVWFLDFLSSFPCDHEEMDKSNSELTGLSDHGEVN